MTDQAARLRALVEARLQGGEAAEGGTRLSLAERTSSRELDLYLRAYAEKKKTEPWYALAGSDPR